MPAGNLKALNRKPRDIPRSLQLTRQDLTRDRGWLNEKDLQLSGAQRYLLLEKWYRGGIVASKDMSGYLGVYIGTS